MTNETNQTNELNDPNDGNGDVVVRPMDDSLDALLRQWHAENAARAAAQRDTLLRAIAESSNDQSRMRKQSSMKSPSSRRQSPFDASADAADRPTHAARLPLAASRLSALAAILILGGTIALFLAAEGRRSDARADILLASEGGKLDAVDARGQLIGPCPLKHTDVDISVSGIFSRVTVRQRYANPYPDKIEAVYTFPLSHRAAVDRMTMTLADRVITGEVKEREQAKAIYRAARSAGHVAGLLEQERPNIFTQSVANIEPGVEIVVEISYVELLESRDGLLGFAFPMVVAPRYIPGDPLSDAAAALPAILRARRGLILYGPATATITAKGDTAQGEIDNDRLTSILSTAQPIDPPEGTWWSDQQPHHPNGQPVIWQQFQAAYAGGGAEAGVLYTDGTGQLGGRWFYVDPKSAAAPPAAQGAGFAANTTQVPDAARITPMPVKPPTRAGHDIAITVHLDTGGPGITDLASESHEINQTYQAIRADGAPREISLSLKEAATIPNKDFVLHWKQTADTITEQVFTHAGPHGNFITLILNPPDRVQNDQVVPRELVFVLDTSGSMQGFPIEKAKEVMSKAIAALRPNDAFNLITFAGDTRILWERPQSASTERLAEAQTFLAGQSGNGGTEMMAAINAALEVKPPVDGIEPTVRPIRIVCFMTDGEVGNDLAIIDAVKKNAGTTRVFSFGIGNSVNRYLLDGIASAGRGAAEYVLLNENADAKVAAFSQRIQSPVLIDPRLEFSPELQVIDRSPEVLPDLYDVAPVIVHARFAGPGKGTVTLRGQSGGGAYERTIEVDTTPAGADHDVIATLWARAKVDDLMHLDLAAAQSGNFPEPLRKEVVALGETFGLMTPFTSFVAVENLRVTLGGEPKLVPIPIELPDGQSWEGTMGESLNKWADDLSAFATPAAGALLYPNFDGDNATATGDLVLYADAGDTPDTASSSKDVLSSIGISTNDKFEMGMEEALQRLRFSETNTPSGSYVAADSGNSSGLMVYHLKHKGAYDIAFTIEDLLKPKSGTGPTFDEGPDEKTMIVKGIKPNQRETIIKLIEMFDTPNQASEEDSVLSLDTKDIPPEVLGRIAKEIAVQSGMTVKEPGDALHEADEPPPSQIRFRAGSSGHDSSTRQPVLGDLPGIGSAFDATAESKSNAKGNGGGPETVLFFDIRQNQPDARELAPPAPSEPLPDSMRFRGSYLDSRYALLPQQPSPGVPSPKVDMWNLVRANNSTPKQFTCPTTTDLPASTAPLPPVASADRLIGGRSAHDRHSLPKNLPSHGAQSITVASLDDGLLVSASGEELARVTELLRQLESSESPRLVEAQSNVTQSIVADAKANTATAASPRVLVDQLLVQIAALHQSDRALDALALADSLLKLRPNHHAAQAMRDAIANGVLNESARARILAAHAARAARRLAALADTTKTLVKRLDERLLRLAMGDASADARQGLSITDAGVQAALLLTDVNDARLKSLKAAGVTIESVSKPTHVIIGRIPAEKLSTLALTDGLRRAEAVATK